MSSEELKARLATAWGAGDWGLVSGWLAPMHEHLVTALAPQQGERWLDAATGTGATALMAARAGADVTAQDLAEGMIDRARRLAESEGLDVRFDVGDVERLPYEPRSFDVVASAVGAILTPSHRATASELARVCRPGGRLGLTAWRPGVGYFQTMHRFYPPGDPDADDREHWGREEYVSELLGDDFELRFESGENPFVGSSGEELWSRQFAGVGPVMALYESLDPDRQEALHQAVVDYFESERVGNEIRAPAAYLLTLGTRR